MIIERLLLISFVWISGAMGSALHGPCLTDDDCGTMDTICHKDVCTCRENFAVWYDSCIPLAHPRITCTKKHECHNLLGIKSMCTKKNQCACKAFHHLHKGQCVKNRDLHDTCDTDHQCYCGADCQEKIACIHRNCSCKAGHSPYKSRRCIAEEPVVLTVADQQMQTSPLEEEPPERAEGKVIVNEQVSKGSTSRVCFNAGLSLILIIALKLVSLMIS